jgi:hypothetical protein
MAQYINFTGKSEAQASLQLTAYEQSIRRAVCVLVSEALQACGVTLSNVAGTIAGRAFEQVIGARLDAAREIALDEIWRGDRSAR